MSERAVHVFIEGRVQGVWFRGRTEQQASRLKLRGWVRNLRAGRVEATFAGSAEVVDEMLKLCWLGPPLARVDLVTVEDIEAANMSGYEKRQSV